MKQLFYPQLSVKLQTPELLETNRFRKVIAFIPHPDDEAIGCGGLLTQLAQKGIEVKIILVSDGSGAGALPEGTSAIREQEFLDSLKILGIQHHEIWRLPDGKLNESPQLFSMVQKAVERYCPDAIIAPWYEDMHADHSAVGYAVKQCTDRGMADTWFYEVWSPLPCTHVADITHVMEIKKEALKAHKTALQCGNYLDGLIGLATYRGLYLPFDIMVKFGEAYALYPKKADWLSRVLKFIAK